MSLIELRNVSKTFQTGNQTQTILDQVNLTVNPGDFVVLRGANGTGKSTLLKLMLGLAQPSQGQVKLFGLPPETPEAKLSLGTIFQEVNPPSDLKVHELLQLVGRYYPQAQTPEDVLALVELASKADAYPKDLSGGEKQRLYFAIALIGNPKLLILDEPTRNLDVEGQTAFWQQVETCHQNGVTILMVTHIQAEQDKLQSLATHIITLADGKLTADKAPNADPEAVTSPPPSPTPQLKPALALLFAQLQAEAIQLVRTPSYLGGIACLFFGSLLAGLNYGLASFTILIALTLLTFSIARTGERIAIERTEGWLKLLRVMPFPAKLYVRAKVGITLVASAIALAVSIAIALIHGGMFTSISQSFFVGGALLLMSLPMVFLGISLGYLLSPKSVNAVTGILVTGAVILGGFMTLPLPGYLQDAIVLSPFFHYGRVAQDLAALGWDQQSMLHIAWLTLYTLGLSRLADFAFQRDKAIG